MDISANHLTRQIDLIPSNSLHVPIHVVGAGAIGSFAVLALAKMGLNNITVYDFDEVSVENMNSQFYRFKDIGASKVLALQSLVKDFTGLEIKVVNRAFVESDAQYLQGIVVSAVDSMEARTMIYNSVKAYGFSVTHIIDPRMSAEYYAQYTINPFSGSDQMTYAKTLYTDKEAVAERCTAKSTVYTATLAAGLVVKTIKDIITKADVHPRIIHWSIASCAAPMMMYPSENMGTK